ncbi:uncharacterized protein LOC135365985 [Ornithodoros turicata]|uniref:uncharacterized protein LOC135365985 n=1 Tax=Ornithodoros turicata TaxID=34597 RepID=UPI0031387B34
MPGTQCCVWTCRNNHVRTRAESNVVSYHSVPKCKRRRREWSESLGMDLPMGRRVCSKHFTVDSYEELLPGSQRRRLKTSALPKMEPEPPSGNSDVREGARSADGRRFTLAVFVEDIRCLEALCSGPCTTADDILVQPVHVDSMISADHSYALSHSEETRSSYAQASLRAESRTIGVQTDPMDFLCTK